MPKSGGQYMADTVLWNFLSVECAAEQLNGNNELDKMGESLYGYSTSGVVEVRDWISKTFSIDGKVLKIRFMHKIVSMMLSGTAWNCV